MSYSSIIPVKKKFLNAATVLAIGCCSLVCKKSYAIDVDAGDYTAAPEGTTLGLVYFQHAESNKLYAANRQLNANGELDANIGIARFIYFTKLGGYTIDPQILLPFGRLSTSGDFSSLGTANGAGDPILAATLWTINDPQNREYLGFTPFLYVPIGNYNGSSALNLGENRWKYAFQIGYIKGLGKLFTIDAMADVTGYGRNDDVGSTSQTMKQDPTYSVQAHLRYHISPTFDLRTSVNRSWIGETTTAGLAAEDNRRVTKMTLGAAWAPTPQVQLIANLGKDIEVTSGFKESRRINLRALYAF